MFNFKKIDNPPFGCIREIRGSLRKYLHQSNKFYTKEDGNAFQRDQGTRSDALDGIRWYLWYTKALRTQIRLFYRGNDQLCISAYVEYELYYFDFENEKIHLHLNAQVRLYQ